MFTFPIKTLNSIKQHLLRQQKIVEENIKEIEKDDPVKDNVLPEASEPGTDSYIADIHAKTLVLGNQLKKARNGIRSALSKITKGTYGKCEECGKQIELGRLLVLPTASLCLSDSKKTSK